MTDGLYAALRTPLYDFLGCDVPILLAGMGGVSRWELAAAVADAGGYPTLGMVREALTSGNDIGDPPHALARIERRMAHEATFLLARHLSEGAARREARHGGE
jgi:NAD(P)H-dependent flavin oxidoreductase YrpB (nitropropane dioxygenase family)